jgi:uncharacterized protein with GYD domain
MAKFLFLTNYTPEGAKGLVKEGAASRRQVLDAMAKGLGGRIESFYFALGDIDAIVIADLPDMAAATAIAVAVNQSGAARVRTTVLLSAEEMDQAAKRPVNYRPPGR